MEPCQHCGISMDQHDYEHRARECLPGRIHALEALVWEMGREIGDLVDLAYEVMREANRYGADYLLYEELRDARRLLADPRYRKINEERS